MINVLDANLAMHSLCSVECRTRGLDGHLYALPGKRLKTYSSQKYSIMDLVILLTAAVTTQLEFVDTRIHNGERQ